MTKIDAAKKFKELPEEQQELIKGIIYTTMDSCTELLQDELEYPIAFPEAVAYKAFVHETMQHYYDKEIFDFSSKKWVKIEGNY